jgi:hypothetical protein
MSERSWVQNLPCGDHFQVPFVWKSMKAKIEWKLTWHCCICCNPTNGRVNFEDGWLIKSSIITKDKTKACQRTRAKLPQKNICGCLCKPISHYPSCHRSSCEFGPGPSNDPVIMGNLAFISVIVLTATRHLIWSTHSSWPTPIF